MGELARKARDLYAKTLKREDSRRVPHACEFSSKFRKKPQEPETAES
jgi:hypothetical protein